MIRFCKNHSSWIQLTVKHIKGSLKREVREFVVRLMRTLNVRQDLHHMISIEMKCSLGAMLKFVAMNVPKC